MLTKTFTYIYPNEPWNPSVTDGNSVTVTWKGQRYYTFSVKTATGEVFAIEDQADDLDQLTNDLPNQIHEGHTFHILDAKENPEVAALLMGDDTIPAKDAAGGIPDYTFETPGSDQDYVFEYNTNNFVASCHSGGLLYNVSSGAFTMPPFLTHMIQKEQLFDGYEADAARVDATLADREDEFTAAEVTILKAHSIWLKGVRAAYANIDAWKIPYPNPNIPY